MFCLHPTHLAHAPHRGAYSNVRPALGAQKCTQAHQHAQTSARTLVFCLHPTHSAHAPHRGAYSDVRPALAAQKCTPVTPAPSSSARASVARPHRGGARTRCTPSVPWNLRLFPCKHGGTKAPNNMSTSAPHTSRGPEAPVGNRVRLRVL